MSTLTPTAPGRERPRRSAARLRALCMGSLCALGSLRFALVTLTLLGIATLWTYRVGSSGSWPMAAALALVSVNLLAAVAVQPAFRSQSGLMVFHVALFAIVVLIALGRLTYLKGHLELSQGEQFNGEVTGYEAGPWHPWGIRDVRFGNEGFTIDYLPGRTRDATRNRVSFRDDHGQLHEVIIGDQVPLVLGGYRFYTSFNKGFALRFLWHPSQGAAQRGTVHLPAYPIHEYRQANTWTPPGASRPLWVQLRFDDPLLDPSGPAQFRTPGSHKVVVRDGAQRVELTPGAAIRIDGGRLVYEGVGTWMGYRVFYDPTIPWLLAACAVAVAGLGWHYWRKFSGRPWQDTPAHGEVA